MSFSFTDDEFDDVIKCFINAAQQMEEDGWWWHCPELTNKAIKRQFLGDMLSAKFPKFAAIFPSPLIKTDDATQQTLAHSPGNNINKVG